MISSGVAALAACGEHNAAPANRMEKTIPSMSKPLRLEIHAPFLTPADRGNIEQVAIRIGAAAFRIGRLAFFGRAVGIDFFDALGDFLIVFDVKTKMIKARLMP